MKKITLIALVLLMTGCAYYNDRMQAAADCLKDPECKKSVENQQAYWKTVAEGTGLPFAGAAAGGVITAIALFFARKKKNEA